MKNVALSILILLSCFANKGESGLIYRKRYRRGNVFDPAHPAYPYPGMPGYAPFPYPIPGTTMSPAMALLPKPPKSWDSKNPFLSSMNDPINPNFGYGGMAIQPMIMGGNMNYPSFNAFRPQESVGGTFGFYLPVANRFGMQAGPFFPWQDRQYAKSIKELKLAQMQLRNNGGVATQQTFNPIVSNGNTDNNANNFNGENSNNFNNNNKLNNRNIENNLSLLPAQTPEFPKFKPVLPPPLPEFH